MPDYLLTEIVKLIDQEKLVVPDFQRGFKWKSANIRRLLESLLLNYPIGAALLWRTQRSSLEYRRIQDVEFSTDDSDDDQDDGSEISENDRETDFILDGQQRITSIYKIFADKIAPTDVEIDSKLQGLRFYLNLKELGLPLHPSDISVKNFSNFEDPECLSFAIVEKTHKELRKELKRVKRGAPAPQRLEERHILEICSVNFWLPISRAFLENRLSNLQRLSRAAITQLEREIDSTPLSGVSISDRKAQAQQSVDIWMDWFTKTYVGTLNSKSFTCLILGNERPDGLARIFETINSTGMSLSVFDLLVARLGRWTEDGKETNLRAKVSESVPPPLLRSFDDEKSLGGSATQQLPRCLALLTGLELKKGEILRTKRLKFDPYLKGVGNRVRHGLQVIHQDMCIIDESWLPFKDLLTLSYACFDPNDNEARHKVKIGLLWMACILEAISESRRNVRGEGLDGRARCDSGQVFEALPEILCGRRPPVRSIAARGCAMEVT